MDKLNLEPTQPKAGGAADDDDDGGAAIEDDYEGVSMANKKKELKLDSEPKILDDGFLGALKMADVPDSDDECYF
jgi:hypothetical protein